MGITAKFASKRVRVIAFDISSYAFFGAMAVLFGSMILNGYELLYFSAMVASSSFLLAYIDIAIWKKRNSRFATTEFLRTLHRIKSDMLLSRTFSSCLSRADSRSKRGLLESAFLQLHTRMRFGQDFNEAVSCVRALGKRELDLLKRLSEEYNKNMDMYLAVKHIYDLLFKDRLELIEKSYASLQKYSSASMVSGTIVPSFFLFAFIGYSLMQGSATQLLAFAVAFLVVLPALFSTVRMLQADLYEF